MKLLTQSLDTMKQARPYLSAAWAWWRQRRARLRLRRLLRRGDRRSWRKAGRGSAGAAKEGRGPGPTA